jgi:type IV secretion system protein VirB2
LTLKHQKQGEKRMLNKLQQQKNRLNEALLLALLALPGASHAASIEGILTRGVAYLQGGLAKALGIIAIVGSGYMCVVKQRLPKEQFAMILVGLGIIFGGGSLYTTLVG